MIDDKALKNLADLARISVTAEELTTLGGELGTIINFIDEINEVSVPTQLSTATAHTNIFRGDEAHPIESVHNLVTAAPDHENGFVKVPKVL